jgi:hypothetical protein
MNRSSPQPAAPPAVVCQAASLAEKPFERDLVASRQRFLADDAQYQLNSHGVFDGRPDWFRLETTELSAGASYP